MNEELDQLFNNLKSLEAAAQTLRDPKMVGALYESAIELVFESEYAKQVVTAVIKEFITHMMNLDMQMAHAMAALERADAFVSVCVHQLLGIIEQNPTPNMTDEQRDALDLSRWTVEIVLNDHGGAPTATQIESVDEMHELAISLNYSTNPDDLRKIVDDNE